MITLPTHGALSTFCQICLRPCISPLLIFILLEYAGFLFTYFSHERNSISRKIVILIGYSLVLLDCDQWTYGTDCASNCTCVVANSEACNATSGDCTCKSGWEGSDCGTNIDECSNIATYSCPTNSACVDTNGSYVCSCNVGFAYAGGQCVGKYLYQNILKYNLLNVFIFMGLQAFDDYLDG